MKDKEKLVAFIRDCSVLLEKYGAEISSCSDDDGGLFINFDTNVDSIKFYGAEASSESLRRFAHQIQNGDFD